MPISAQRSTAFPTIRFFPVDNGDMTLITTASGKNILIDCNIRQKADNENDPTPDVANMLKGCLPQHNQTPFVDVFVLTHPDRDHLAGLAEHFHLGDPGKTDGSKILIGEMWTSPLVFRRANQVDGADTPEAKAWRDEVKRRTDCFTDNIGNRVVMLGDDSRVDTSKKHPGLTAYSAGCTFNRINGTNDHSVAVTVLAPQVRENEESEKIAATNDSSIVLQWTLTPGSNLLNVYRKYKFLTTGDIKVGIANNLWNSQITTRDQLQYDILLTPHHCSLGSLSEDQYNPGNGRSGKGEDCEIDPDALAALSQANEGAYIVCSTKMPEKGEGKELAWRLYRKIAKSVNGTLLCTMKDSPRKPLTLSLTPDGIVQDTVREPPRAPGIKDGGERGYA